MNNKEIKQVRGQVRQVTQELLPSLLQTEVFQGLYERLQKDMITRLEQISQDVKSQLSQMDSRSKDIQQFIMNQVQQNLAQQASNVTPVTPGQETTVTG